MFFLIVIPFFLELSDNPFTFFRGDFGDLASIYSSIEDLLGSSQGLISCLGSDVHENDGVSNQVAFDEVIKGCLS